MIDGCFIKIIILIFLLILSAFFSSSETVFSSVNTIRLESYLKNKKRGSRLALKLAEDFDHTISTILIGNNIVNITMTVIATKLFTDLFGINGVFIATLVMTVTILLFGEFLPKTLAKKNTEELSLKYSRVLRLFQIILFPISKLLLFLNLLVSKLIKSNIEEPSVTEEELISIVKAIEDEGVLEEKESELIRSAITFDDINITGIYKEIEDIVTVNIEDKLDNILDIVLDYHYSRIPVYKKDKSNIIGILYEKDFLDYYIKEKNKLNIKDLIHKPIKVKGNMRISNLLTLFQEKKEHMGIVTNNNDEAIGIITLEDTIEALVGEIEDEHDENRD